MRRSVFFALGPSNPPPDPGRALSQRLSNGWPDDGSRAHAKWILLLCVGAAV